MLLALSFPFVPEALRLPVVVTAGVSDVLDGVIARHFGVTSWQGGLLDGAADKLFTTTALIVLTSADLLQLWELGLILTRDLCVAGACIVVLLRRRFGDFERMQSRFAGKATTLLIFVLMSALLLDLEPLRFPLLGLCIASSFAAAVDSAQSFFSDA